MMDFVPVEEWVHSQLGSLVEEAHDLRFGVSAGEPSDSLKQIHDRLLLVRARQDRVEEILAVLLRMQATTDQAVADRKSAVDDKWDKEATKTKVGFQYGDAAPRERYAKYNLNTVNEQRGLRNAEKVQRQVRTAVELCRMFHNGLEGIRWTLNHRLSAMATTTRLER